MPIGMKTTFWKLISDKNLKNITIPQIQRDYVQGRSNEKVNFSRKKLISDIRSSILNSNEIDLNFVYGKEENNLFVPIDGQQRLTTLLTLHIYAFGKDKFTDKLNLLKTKFLYETRITTKRFIEKLIENIEDYFTNNNYTNIKDYVTDSSWYSRTWERDPSILSFLVVLDEIDINFKDIENLADILISDNCPLTFMSLKIDDVGRTNDLYIKMNSRGKPLTNFENFKSFLYEYIENSNFIEKDDFKAKMDNLWMSFVWELLDNPMKDCDDRFLLLIDLIIKNRLMAFKNNNNNYNENDWNQLFKENNYYNFVYYKNFLNNEIIIDIYYTFEFLLFYTNYATDFTIADWTKNLLTTDFNPGHKEKVKLAVITKYAISKNRNDWNVTEFDDWHRILDNLINNTPIDVEYRTQSALNAVYLLDDDYCEDPIKKFGNNFNISFFDDTQKEEEKLKCKLINGNNDWKNILIDAEMFPYFNGNINFALKLVNIIDDSPSSLTINKLNDFKRNWLYIKLIFNSQYEGHIIGQNNIFRRSLLTFGDFSFDTNSCKTYFFEGKKDYFNWRRMLKENLSFNIFKTFFNDLISKVNPRADEIIKQMESYIVNYQDTSNAFIYNLIKIPELFSFMKFYKFKIDSLNGNRIILYSGATLQAKYAEAYTYIAFLKYGPNNKYTFGQNALNGPETKAYISEVNNHPCHIEFNPTLNNFYDENGLPIVYNGINISDIDTLLIYMSTK